MLDLDEALDSELVRAREMVVELDQPGTERRAAARRAGQAVAHARRRRRARARRWASTRDEVLAAARLLDEDEIAALEEAGAVAGPVAGAQGSFMSA